MSRPTIAGLTEKLEAQEAKTAQVRRVIEGIDTEARAYSDCVNALSKLTASGSYASTNKHPDRDAIGRVLHALKLRFNITDDKVEPTQDFHEFHYEEPTDPRSDVIAQMIEALRKS